MKPWLEKTQRQLSRQYRDNILPHAILLSGVHGAGHEELGFWLVNIILCDSVIYQQDNAHNNGLVMPCQKCKHCQLLASNNYPDHITLSTDKNSLGVDSVRKISQFFEKTAHLGHAKTALIIDADLMTVSAANALLKTLEEPTPNSFIILTTEQRETLLPTIISRCRKIDIRPPVGQALLESCELQGNDKFINLSHFPELNNREIGDDFERFSENFQQYLCYHSKRKEVLSQLNDNKNAFRWLEKIIVDGIRGQWGWYTNSSLLKETSTSFNKNTLWQAYNLVQTANKKLHTLAQVNKPLFNEKLLADIAFLLREVEE